MGYRIEFVLLGGANVVFDVTDEEAAAHAKNLMGDKRPELSDREHQIRGLINVILRRIEKGTGFFSASDVSGKFWIVPAQAIITANVLDLAEKRPSRIGFEDRPG